MRNGMKTNSRNRVETQSGNEERGRGRAGEGVTETSIEEAQKIRFHPAVQNGRMKAYFLGRLDGGLGQSVRQPAHRADVLDTPVGAEDDSQHDRALDFVLTGLFGVFGFLAIENCRFQFFGHDGYTAARASSGTATGAILSPADTATEAWPIAWAITLPDSGSWAGAA